MSRKQNLFNSLCFLFLAFLVSCKPADLDLKTKISIVDNKGNPIPATELVGGHFFISAEFEFAEGGPVVIRDSLKSNQTYYQAEHNIQRTLHPDNFESSISVLSTKITNYAAVLHLPSMNEEVLGKIEVTNEKLDSVADADYFEKDDSFENDGKHRRFSANAKIIFVIDKKKIIKDDARKEEPHHLKHHHHHHEMNHTDT